MSDQQSRSAVAAQPRRPDRTGPDPLAERRRSWVVVGMACCLVLIFMSIWVTYARSHTTDRYEQLPPGDSTTVDGSTLRVINMKQADVVTDGDKPNPSQAGAVWVIVTMEVTIQHTQDTVNCKVELVSDDDRVWDSPESFFSRKLPQYCGDNDDPIKPGVPWRFEQIFEIPQRFSDRLFGVAVPDNASAEPTKVIRPVRS